MVGKVWEGTINQTSRSKDDRRWAGWDKNFADKSSSCLRRCGLVLNGVGGVGEGDGKGAVVVLEGVLMEFQEISR